MLSSKLSMLRCKEVSLDWLGLTFVSGYFKV